MESEAALGTIKINAIKSFAMLELVGLYAWSQYGLVTLDFMPQLLGINPITLIAICLFLSLHLYAHSLESNENKTLTVSSPK